MEESIPKAISKYLAPRVEEINGTLFNITDLTLNRSVNSSVEDVIKNIEWESHHNTMVRKEAHDASVAANAEVVFHTQVANCREAAKVVTGKDRCADIKGGKWTVVRHIPACTLGWHLATDHLAGTQEYGNQTNLKYNAPDPWSVIFSHIHFDEFLFATADCEIWLIATRAAVMGDEYEEAVRPIAYSSIQPNGPSSARWHNRQDKKGDPWISLVDYKNALNSGEVVYAEAGMGGENAKKGLPGGATQALPVHGGANVYIRHKEAHFSSLAEG